MYCFTLFFGEGWNGGGVDHLWSFAVLRGVILMWVVLGTDGIFVDELFSGFSYVVGNG